MRILIDEVIVMTVFVMMGGIQYEGYTLLGVFSSREQAEAYQDDYRAVSYDWIDIVEREIDTGIDPYFS